MKKLRGNTPKPQVLVPVWPNVGVQVWYQQTLDAMVNEAARDLQHDIDAAWRKAPPVWDGSHITAYYGDAAPTLNAAGIAFFVGDRLLLLCRNDGEGWAFPGGHLEENEDFETAARREAFEETLHPHNGFLEPYRLQEWRNVNFATYKAELLEEFEPTLNSEHSAFVWVTIPEALQMPLHPGVRATLTAKQIESVAYDAPSPTKALQIALARWGSQMVKRFDAMSATIANDFATRSKRATQTAMMAQLKKAGFTIQFKPSRESIEAYRLVAAENVALIKSIPRKYHEQVEAKVWNAVRSGGKLHELSTKLREQHGITVRRAALIARDQNNKAKAVIERVRQQELGITQGLWMHSHAGITPRPTHVAMNGQLYDLAKGMWDSDEREWVHPGQLINCRCTMRPVVEGFE